MTKETKISLGPSTQVLGYTTVILITGAIIANAVNNHMIVKRALRWTEDFTESIFKKTDSFLKEAAKSYDSRF